MPHTIEPLLSQESSPQKGFFYLPGDGLFRERRFVMSSKQVPEREQLPIAEQMRRLEAWIIAHREVFEKYRGGRELYCFSQFSFITPDPNNSPAAQAKWYKKITGDIGVLRNAQAVFHRDGCSAAAEMLNRALMDTDRWDRPVKLPFEDELPDEKEPMVLLVFDPERMFPIMHWFSQNNNLWQLDALWDEGVRHVQVREDTRAIVAMLPSLERHFRECQHRRAPYQAEVFRAIGDDVLGVFGGIQNWFDPRDWAIPVAALYVEGMTRDAGPKAYDGVALAYLLRGVEQADVLERIPRSLQGRVATWQFRVYHKTWFGIPSHRLMLIPEDELPIWQGIYKTSVSMGVSAGHVAVYNPDHAFQSLPNGNYRDMKKTPVLNNR